MKNKISRRQFLQVAGASAAALLLASCSGNSASSVSSSSVASSEAASSAAASSEATSTVTTTGKTLVVYFSATGTTQGVAQTIAATAVDVHRNFLHIAQRGKIVRKLLRRNFIAPPAAFGNIAVKQKFRFLAVCQIAELPETVIRFGCLRVSRLIHDSVRSLLGRFLHSQCRPPPFSFLLQ